MPTDVLQGYLITGLKIFSLFLCESICCQYSLEVPHSTSNESPQHDHAFVNK